MSDTQADLASAAREIAAELDCAKIAKAMAAVGWQWGFPEKYQPTPEQVHDAALELLRTAISSGGSVASGGFTAYGGAHPWIEFTLESTACCDDGDCERYASRAQSAAPVPLTPAPKYIEFRELQKQPERKTSQYEVWTLEGEELLGHVEWFGRWRCFTFRPLAGTSTWFEHRCLRDIAAFTERLTQEHRAFIASRGKGNQK